jgi:hypothetical protein
MNQDELTPDGWNNSELFAGGNPGGFSICDGNSVGKVESEFFFLQDLLPREFQDKIVQWISFQKRWFSIVGMKWNKSEEMGVNLQIDFVSKAYPGDRQKQKYRPLAFEAGFGYPVAPDSVIRQHPSFVRARVVYGYSENEVVCKLVHYRARVPVPSLFIAEPIKIAGDLWMAVVAYTTHVIRVTLGYDARAAGEVFQHAIRTLEAQGSRPDILSSLNSREMNVDIALPMVDLPIRGNLLTEFFHSASRDSVEEWVSTKRDLYGITVSNPAYFAGGGEWYSMCVFSSEIPVLRECDVDDYEGLYR